MKIRDKFGRVWTRMTNSEAFHHLYLAGEDYDPRAYSDWWRHKSITGRTLERSAEWLEENVAPLKSD